MDVWRQHAYSRGISASDDASAKRKAFARAAEHLALVGKIGIYDDKAWLAS
jgi:hypothetical protein